MLSLLRHSWVQCQANFGLELTPELWWMRFVRSIQWQVQDNGSPCSFFFFARNFCCATLLLAFLRLACSDTWPSHARARGPIVCKVGFALNNLYGICKETQSDYLGSGRSTYLTGRFAAPTQCDTGLETSSQHPPLNKEKRGIRCGTDQ